jgi:hypothetical protein
MTDWGGRASLASEERDSSTRRACQGRFSDVGNASHHSTLSVPRPPSPAGLRARRTPSPAARRTPPAGIVGSLGPSRDVRRAATKSRWRAEPCADRDSDGRRYPPRVREPRHVRSLPVARRRSISGRLRSRDGGPQNVDHASPEKAGRQGQTPTPLRAGSRRVRPERPRRPVSDGSGGRGSAPYNETLPAQHLAAQMLRRTASVMSCNATSSVDRPASVTARGMP